MAANNISTLATKEARQNAKLALAEAKRQASGTNGYRALNTLDTALLPATYAPGDNDQANRVDNDNTGGLQEGRPWK